MEELLAFLRDAWQEPPVRSAAIVVVSVAVAKIVQVVGSRVLLRLTGHTRSDLDDRLVRQMRSPVFVTVLCVGLYAAVHAAQLEPAWTARLISIVHTVLILTWLVHGMRLVSTVLEAFSRLADRVTWIETRTVPLFDNLAKLLIFGGAVYLLLVAWQLDVTPWLASAGVAGIAIGFAAKDTLANLFGGLFVIMDSPYKIGDYINLDSGERGKVIKIGLRSTRLLTRDDVEITVPNAAIANAKVINESGGPWEKVRVEIHVGVAYGSDVSQVKEVLQRSLESIEQISTDPAPRVRFHQMGDSALIFRVMGWIDEPELRGQAVDALNTAVYENLNATGITIPFPQRDVHLYRATSD